MENQKIQNLNPALRPSFLLFLSLNSAKVSIKKLSISALTKAMKEGLLTTKEAFSIIWTALKKSAM